MTDSLENRHDSAIDAFRVRIDCTPNPASRKSLGQALDSFRRFLAGSDAALADIDESMLGEWVSWMFAQGYSPKTVAYYVNRLSSLHGKASESGHQAFSRIKSRLADTQAAQAQSLAPADCFDRLRALVLKDCSKSPLRQLAKDITLFSIYAGGLPLEDVARCRKDDYRGSDEAVKEIVARYAKPRNKYLFPLNQSERTPTQTARAITALYADALKMAGFDQAAISAHSPIDLWIAVATRCGLPAAEISACAGEAGSANPITAFASPKEIGCEEIGEMRGRVANVLAEDPENWYAMQFRPHVSHSMLTDRLRAEGITLRQTYYPMEQIMRQIGKRLKPETKPVMPGILFFKSRATELPDLFCAIGDLAWGYRQSRAVRSPYAAIPAADIHAYAMAVGQFTDSIDRHPDGTIAIEPGDKIEITGGQLKGLTAIFEKEIQDTADRITYRLRLTAQNSITWTVDLDPRLTAKRP